MINDAATIDRLVNDNIALVVFSMGKLGHSGDEHMYAIGLDALRRSARIFDSAKGTFSTLAVTCIMRDMIRERKVLAKPQVRQRGNRVADGDSNEPRKITFSTKLLNDKNMWLAVHNDPSDRMARNDTSRLVRRMLRKLTKKQRTVIKGIYLQGRSETDIASEMGITKQAVSLAKHRAMVNLRKMYPSETDL